MFRHFILVLTAGLVLLGAGPASAERVVEVPAGIVRLGQIWAAAPPELQSLEIGPSPPPGSSRLVLRRELERRLSQAGVTHRDLDLPRASRIETLSERWSSERLREAATEQALRVLPPGIELAQVKTQSQQVVPAGTRVSGVEIGKIPRRAGTQTLPAMLLLEYGGSVVRRVPVSLVLNVSEASTLPLVSRGALVRVYVQRTGARIAAQAEALQDGNAGDTIQFRIHQTQRRVHAVVESAQSARMVTR